MVYSFPIALSSVQSLSHVWLFATPWTAARQASPSINNSRSLLKLYPLSWWYHPTISSSVIPFSSGLQSFPKSVHFSSATQSCPTLWDPMNCSMPGHPVNNQLPEFTQTQVHRVGDAIQPSHPLSSPSLPVPGPSQNQSLFQWVNASHEVAKVLEFQL